VAEAQATLKPVMGEGKPVMGERDNDKLFFFLQGARVSNIFPWLLFCYETHTSVNPQPVFSRFID
jgi:hypothetical protein